MSSWDRCPNCIVYCAKYLAAKGDYAQAVEHFRNALEAQVTQNESSKSFPWICYNYARAVREGNLEEYRQDAKEKCREALKFEKSIPSLLMPKKSASPLKGSYKSKYFS